MPNSRIGFSFLVLLLAAALTSSADDPKVALDPRAKPQIASAAAPRTDLRVDTNVVLIPTTVHDPLGKCVTGLEIDNFTLTEDKVDQKIQYFNSEDAPISIGLVFDTSGSMGNKLSQSREAIRQFFRTANPEDEFFLVHFNDRPEVLEDFTTSLEEIQNRLIFTPAKGRTALLDAVLLSMNKMKKGKHARKALLIISDGGDNSSRYTESEIKNRVREANVQIYAIGILEPLASRGRSSEEMSGPGLLNELAEATGGRFFAVDNIGELPDVAAKIGIELRNQYILGYTSTNRERDGKYRKVQVKVTLPKHMPAMKTYFRQGYYAPAQ